MLRRWRNVICLLRRRDMLPFGQRDMPDPRTAGVGVRVVYQWQNKSKRAHCVLFFLCQKIPTTHRMCVDVRTHALFLVQVFGGGVGERCLPFLLAKRRCQAAEANSKVACDHLFLQKRFPHAHSLLLIPIPLHVQRVIHGADLFAFAFHADDEKGIAQLGVVVNALVLRG